MNGVSTSAYRACTRYAPGCRQVQTAYKAVSHNPRIFSAHFPARLLTTSQTQLESQSTSDLSSVTSTNISVPASDDALSTPDDISLFQSSTRTTDNGETQSQPQLQQQQTRPLIGTVSRVGTMKQCVQITYQRQTFDPFLQKNFSRPARVLVHDPNPEGYLREGDVIEYSAWTDAEREARLQRQTQIEAKLKQEAAEKGMKLPKKFVPTYKLFDKTGKRRTGNHGTGEDPWRGPRYMIRRMITPFGTPLESRMEDITQALQQNKDTDLETTNVGSRGRGSSTRPGRASQA